MTDKDIQAGEELEPADEKTTEGTVEDNTGSPSDTPEPVQAGKGQSSESAEGTEEVEYEPFKHVVKYKADGKEFDAVYEYDKDGNFTPETEERIRQVHAKTGLEKLAQDKHDKWQTAEKAREAAEARAKFFEGQLKTVEDTYRKPIDFIRQNPNLAKAMQQKGVVLPDTERIRFDREKAELASQKREIVAEGFVRQVGQSVSEKYPDLTTEQYNAIGQELLTTPMMRRLQADPNADLNAAVPDVLYETELVVAKMVRDGKLPNPELEKARRETESARQGAQVIKERAQKRQAIVNPLAGGKPRSGGSGREKVVNMRGWTAREAAEYAKTGKLPAR